MQSVQQCAEVTLSTALGRGFAVVWTFGGSIAGRRLAILLDSPLCNVAGRPRHSFTGLLVSVMRWHGSQVPEIMWGRVLLVWSNGGDVWVVLCWFLTKSTRVPQTPFWCNSDRYHDPGVSFWMGKKSTLALMCHFGQCIFSSPL